MKLNLTHHDDLQRARAAGLPLILPAGNTEYHGPHCVCGCDTLITEGVANLLEREIPLVLAPTMAYCPSTYAASGPEGNTVDIDMEDFGRYAKGILRSFLEGGWRPEAAAGAQEWFAQSAAEASEALGRRMLADILEDLKQKI